MRARLAEVAAYLGLVLASIAVGIELSRPKSGPPAFPKTAAFDAISAKEIKVSGKIGAKRIMVQDAKGDDRMGLGMGGEGKPEPFLAAYDSKGEARVTIAIMDDMPLFSFYDETGKARLFLMQEKGGSPSISLADANEKRRFVATLVGDGNPFINMIGQNAAQDITLSIAAKGLPMLLLRDGKMRKAISTNPELTLPEHHNLNMYPASDSGVR